MTRTRVVIIGGGFGGLAAARALRHTEVVLIDRTNHHLFQPLLYQVATAALSPSDIAWPLRSLFRLQPNVRVVLDDAVAIDRVTRTVYLQESPPIAFDVLIVASGSRHAYFGHDEWEPFAPGLKTMADAVRLRERMLLALLERPHFAANGLELLPGRLAVDRCGFDPPARLPFQPGDANHREFVEVAR